MWLPGPGLHSFVFEPLFTVGGFEFNKPMLLALLSTVVVVWFFWAAFGKAKVVPGKLQMVAEAGYDFVRRGIVYEALGKKEGEKYVPFMVALFFFVWIMNLWSIIPLAQFPVTSVIAFPAGLAADRLRHLDVPDLQEARLRRRLQEHHRLRQVARLRSCRWSWSSSSSRT